MGEISRSERMATARHRAGYDAVASDTEDMLEKYADSQIPLTLGAVIRALNNSLVRVQDHGGSHRVVDFDDFVDGLVIEATK